MDKKLQNKIKEVEELKAHQSKVHDDLIQAYNLMDQKYPDAKFSGRTFYTSFKKHPELFSRLETIYLQNSSSKNGAFFIFKPDFYEKVSHNSFRVCSTNTIKILQITIKNFWSYNQSKPIKQIFPFVKQMKKIGVPGKLIAATVHKTLEHMRIYNVIQTQDTIIDPEFQEMMTLI